MKVLITGTGIIGVIYGWALHKAGVDVTHFVRKGKSGKYSEPVKIDILDERKGYPKYNKTTYQLNCIESINDNYNLVIVPTNWYQTEGVLKSLIPFCKNSFFYILTSNWTGADMYERLLTADRYILGYPDGGGTVRDGYFWTNIGPEIHIANPVTENKNGYELVSDVFAKADIKLDVQENILHWLWVHNAGSIPILAAFQKYRNIEKYLQDKSLLKKSIYATRECLKLCEKRGAYSKKYPEISAFKLPNWLLIPMFKYNFRHNESMKRYTAHAESAPVEDLVCNYQDILKTAVEIGFEMPHYIELGKYINLKQLN
jgi:2-dehydropantoate 2-reductase